MMKLFDSFASEVKEYLSIDDYKKVLEADGGQGDLGDIPNGVLGVFTVNYMAGAGIPYGISRNGRLYTKKVWDKAFSNKKFKEVFENGLLVGMISHPEEDIDYDTMLKEGLASHVLKNIKYIEKDKNSGIYEGIFYILDTPAGRTLKTLLASGANIAVSTRAFGEYKKGEFVEYNGKKLPVIDENNFMLITIDAVTQPGIEKARITNFKLSESEKKQLKEDLSYLKEKVIEYRCEMGICELFEDKKEIKLEELDKKDLIEIIETIKNENKRLQEEINSNKNKPEDEKDKKVDKETQKNITIFISNVEALMKLLKASKKHENDYNKLIEIIDKDNFFSENDIKEVKKILEKIINDEEVDESLQIFAKKFKDFIDNNKFESVTYYLYLMYNNWHKKLTESISDLTKNIRKLQNKYEEAKNEIKEKNEVIENLNEELNSFNKKIQDNQNVVKENLKLIKTIDEKINEIKKYKEKFEKIKREKEMLEKELNELKEKVEGIISKKDEYIEKLEKQVKKIKDEYNEKFTEMNKAIEEYKTKFYVLKYKVPENIVKENLENENIEEILKTYNTSNINNYEVSVKEEKNPIEEFINKII